MSLRLQSWVATVLLVGGFIVALGGAKAHSPAMMVVSLLSVLAGLGMLVIVVRNTSRAIRGYGSQTDSMLREIAKAAEERKKRD